VISYERSVGFRSLAWTLALTLVAALLTTVPSAPAQAAMPDAEARMLGHINSARQGNGLGTLRAHDTLTKVARDWAVRMKDDHESGGDRQAVLRHNPSMHGQIPSNYRRAGENVGYTVLSGASDSALVDRLHKAYMASPGHRANIMGEFDRVGVGLVAADDGTLWSTVVFMLEAAPAAASNDTSAEPVEQDEPEPAPAAQREPGADAEPEKSSASRVRGESGPSRPAPAPEPEPEPEPEPAPPTSEELFDEEWPQGYLTGDADIARSLLLGITDVRLAGSLLWETGRGAPVRLAGRSVTR
jgi:uncharacterized protein YkwD